MLLASNLKIKFHCSCGKRYLIAPEQSGDSLDCLYCQQKIILPDFRDPRVLGIYYDGAKENKSKNNGLVLRKRLPRKKTTFSLPLLYISIFFNLCFVGGFTWSFFSTNERLQNEKETLLKVVDSSESPSLEMQKKFSFLQEETQKKQNTSEPEEKEEFVEEKSITQEYSFHLDAGSQKIKSGKLEESIHSFSTAIQMDPKRVEAYLARALAYEKAQKIEEALKDYAEAILLFPERHDLYFKRGHLRFSQKEYKEAILDYSKAIQYHSLAEYYQERGKRRKSLKNLLKRKKIFKKPSN
jgi:tetratricopeptide (TPR) repeat protein